MVSHQNQPKEKLVTRLGLIRLLTLAMFSMALIVTPLVTPVRAAGGESPSPPPSDSNAQDKKKDKSSNLEDSNFKIGRADV